MKVGEHLQSATESIVYGVQLSCMTIDLIVIKPQICKTMNDSQFVHQGQSFFHKVCMGIIRHLGKCRPSIRRFENNSSPPGIFFLNFSDGLMPNANLLSSNPSITVHLIDIGLQSDQPCRWRSDIESMYYDNWVYIFLKIPSSRAR